LSYFASFLDTRIEAVGVEGLTAARAAAAQRKEHVPRSNDIAKELAKLEPGDRSQKFAPTRPWVSKPNTPSSG
jgi:hypothetical protein